MSKFIEDASTLSVTWVKGTRSGDNADCIEVASIGDAVFIRDSKNLTGPALAYTRTEWDALRLGIKDGEFDNI